MNYPLSLKLHDATLTNQKGSDVKIATQYDTKQISDTFHEKRVMYGGFDLLANHLLVLFIILTIYFTNCLVRAMLYTTVFF